MPAPLSLVLCLPACSSALPLHIHDTNVGNVRFQLPTSAERRYVFQRHRTLPNRRIRCCHVGDDPSKRSRQECEYNPDFLLSQVKPHNSRTKLCDVRAPSRRRIFAASNHRIAGKTADHAPNLTPSCRRCDAVMSSDSPAAQTEARCGVERTSNA